MIIYTGGCGGEKLEGMIAMGLGVMVSTSATFAPRAEFSRLPCALDNGAYQFWNRGYPFLPDIFRKTLYKAYEVGIDLDFVVCPDIVGGGKKSLDFSMEWATGELKTCQRLALAVQDGIEPKDIGGYELSHFSYIFIGGTETWKWKTAEAWIKFAHDNKKKCHIGKVGTLDRLNAAERFGADSVDSTNFVRNDSWDIIEQFRSKRQGVLI